MVQAGFSTVVKIRKCILYVPVVHCPWPSRAFTEPPGPGEHVLHRAGRTQRHSRPVRPVVRRRARSPTATRMLHLERHRNRIRRLIRRLNLRNAQRFTWPARRPCLHCRASSWQVLPTTSRRRRYDSSSTSCQLLTFLKYSKIDLHSR